VAAGYDRANEANRLLRHMRVRAWAAVDASCRADRTSSISGAVPAVTKNISPDRATA